MVTSIPWTPTLSVERSDETPCGTEGLIEQSRALLLGSRSAAWLKRNESKAFEVADSGIGQALESQAILQKLHDDYACGVVPQQSVCNAEGKWEEKDLSPLQFAERITALTLNVLTAAEKAISIRNKVASGGTNLFTAALLSSSMIQNRVNRQERSANPAPRKRYGVDARIEIQADAEVVEG